MSQARFRNFPLSAVRQLRIAVLASAAAAGFTALGAQTIAVNAGSAPTALVLPNGKITVPVIIDLTNASATNIASLATGIAWGTSRLTFDSLRVVSAVGWSFIPNIAGAAGGSVSFSASNGVALPATATLANVFFTATGASGGTRLTLTPTAAANALAASILPLIQPRMLDVCVALSGSWGDVTSDGVVNIIDAQQIARFSVGLSVLDANALSQRGDVNNDGVVNIIDAQQIARFSVSLTTSPRTNTNAFVAPVIATATLTPSTTQALVPGGTVQLVATARDVASADISGCSNFTWGSSNTGIVTVNASGFVTAVANGSATITATSVTTPAVTAALTVNVTASAPPASVAFAGTGQAILDQATTAATIAQVRDVNGVVVPAVPVSFVSRTPAIATVNSTGTITGVARGQAVIVVNVTGSPGIADSLLAIVRTPGAPVLVSSLTRFTLKKDTTLTVSIFVNMGASATKVSASLLTVTWDPAVLGYVSNAAGAGPAATVNSTSAATGSLTLAFANTTGFTGNVEVLRITFTGGSTIGANGTLTVTAGDVAASDFSDLAASMLQIVQRIVVR